MNSNKINKTITYQINIAANEHKNKENSKNIGKNFNDEDYTAIDDSVISKDAELGYEFLSRIEASAGDINRVQNIEKYASEYKKIRDEIASGKYGNDAKKCMKLLDNAFKDSLENAANILKKSLDETLNKTNEKHNKIKFSGAQLIQYHKQYEMATGIAWMLRAENKRISKDIEEYRKKKDHSKVASLTQLKNSYNRIINNVSDIATKIRSDIDDNYSEDKNRE